MKSFRVYILLLVVVFFSGCSVIENQFESKPSMPRKPYHTYTLDETIQKVASDLVYELDRKDAQIDNLALTVYVQLDNFTKTSKFGRLLSESLIQELDSQDVKVVDYRGQRAVSINGTGEFFLSRNINKLNSSVATKYILVGTYTKVDEGYLINTRIVDNTNGSVMSSSRLIFNTKECRLFGTCKPSNRKIQIASAKWKM